MWLNAGIRDVQETKKDRAQRFCLSQNPLRPALRFAAGWPGYELFLHRYLNIFSDFVKFRQATL